MSTIGEVFFTKHGWQRLTEMGLTPGEVQATLTNPEVTMPGTRTRDRYGNRVRHERPSTVRQFVRAGMIVVADVAEPHRPRVITILVRTRDVYTRP